MVDGLLCVLLDLLAEHGLLLRQPVETDVCIIVSKLYNIFTTVISYMDLYFICVLIHEIRSI